MKQKYKEYLRLNKNILLAFAASITISAIAADYFSDQYDYLNTTLTLAVDYGVFFQHLVSYSILITEKIQSRNW
uniref:Uncharacterized protein n=1 Tax=uncultured marine thaumarchaeote AD1000_30_G09 TaxID=1455905 RepID=A0A075FP64_9ARCH|nr:hypothetical protein [uncultured marine thaumarchaeote AD1000_30_G09]